MSQKLTSCCFKNAQKHYAMVQNVEKSCSKCGDMLKMQRRHAQNAEKSCSKCRNVMLKMQKRHAQNAETSYRDVMRKMQIKVMLKMHHSIVFLCIFNTARCLFLRHNFVHFGIPYKKGYSLKLLCQWRVLLLIGLLWKQVSL